MADDAAERGPGAIGELCGGRFLVRRLTQAHLDELVLRQGLVERTHQGLAESGLADEDDRFEGMGEATQVTALRTIQTRRSSSRGSGVAGHSGLLSAYPAG
jgi:hypothetical protein